MQELTAIKDARYQFRTYRRLRTVEFTFRNNLDLTKNPVLAFLVLSTVAAPFLPTANAQLTTTMVTGNASSCGVQINNNGSSMYMPQDAIPVTAKLTPETGKYVPNGASHFFKPTTQQEKTDRKKAKTSSTTSEPRKIYAIKQPNQKSFYPMTDLQVNMAVLGRMAGRWKTPDQKAFIDALRDAIQTSTCSEDTIKGALKTFDFAIEPMSFEMSQLRNSYYFYDSKKGGKLYIFPALRGEFLKNAIIDGMREVFLDKANSVQALASLLDNPQRLSNLLTTVTNGDLAIERFRQILAKERNGRTLSSQEQQELRKGKAAIDKYQGLPTLTKTQMTPVLSKFLQSHHVRPRDQITLPKIGEVVIRKITEKEIEFTFVDKYDDFIARHRQDLFEAEMQKDTKGNLIKRDQQLCKYPDEIILTYYENYVGDETMSHSIIVSTEQDKQSANSLSNR